VKVWLGIDEKTIIRSDGIEKDKLNLGFEFVRINLFR
jgi:hypothetical protein